MDEHNIITRLRLVSPPRWVERRDDRIIQLFRGADGESLCRIWWPRRYRTHTTETTCTNPRSLYGPSPTQGHGEPWPEEIAVALANGYYQSVADINGWDNPARTGLRNG
jgi:hypothetical protein